MFFGGSALVRIAYKNSLQIINWLLGDHWENHLGDDLLSGSVSLTHRSQMLEALIQLMCRRRPPTQRFCGKQGDYCVSFCHTKSTRSLTNTWNCLMQASHVMTTFVAF